MGECAEMFLEVPQNINLPADVVPFFYGLPLETGINACCQA